MNKVINITIHLVILLSCCLVAKGEIPEYQRSQYGGWIDADKDCQDTRQEVLIEESLIPVVLDKSGCKVLSGKWYDPYTDNFYYDPKILDIDHMIPLKEAHISGAYSWSKEKKVRYANDLDNGDFLIAVHRKANRKKGAKDPSLWLPSNKKYHCEYISNWVLIKLSWELSTNKQENIRINNLKKECHLRN